MKRSPLSRTKPLSARSKKRRTEEPIRKAVREAVLERDGGRCQARLRDICLRVATDVHEIQSRGRGGDYLDPTNCVSLCRACHKYITESPRWSETYGWLLHSWATPADAEAAARARTLRMWELDEDGLD